MVWPCLAEVLVSVGDQCNKDLYDFVVILHGYSLVVTVKSALGFSVDNVGIHAVEVVAQVDVLTQIRVAGRRTC